MTTVVTRQGERWDELSQRVFGRPDLYPLIWRAADACACLQRRYPSILDGGIVLRLPEPAAVPATTQATTPPWRR